MNKLAILLPFLSAISLTSPAIASENSSVVEEQTVFEVSDEQLEFVRDLVFEAYTPNSKINWLDITAKFTNSYQNACENFDKSHIRMRIKVRFSNNFMNKVGSRHEEWLKMIAGKEDEAKKPKREGEKRVPLIVLKKLKTRVEQPREAEEEAAAPAPNAVSFEWSTEDLDILRDLALANLVDLGRQRLNYDELAQEFRTVFENRCADIEDEDLLNLVKKKFNSAFVQGSRSAEWKQLRLENDVKVAPAPQKKRAKEDGEVEVVEANPVETKKVAVQELLPAPKKSIALLMSVLELGDDDKFVSTFELAQKTGQNCVTCVHEGYRQPVLVLVLQKERYPLFRRLVALGSVQSALDLPVLGGDTLRTVLSNYILERQHFALLPHLLGEAAARALAQKQFLAAVSDGKEAEIELWFASKLIDWSTELVTD